MIQKKSKIPFPTLFFASLTNRFKTATSCDHVTRSPSVSHPSMRKKLNERTRPTGSNGSGIINGVISAITKSVHHLNRK